MQRPSALSTASLLTCLSMCGAGCSSPASTNTRLPNSYQTSRIGVLHASPGSTAANPSATYALNDTHWGTLPSISADTPRPSSAERATTSRLGQADLDYAPSTYGSVSNVAIRNEQAIGSALAGNHPAQFSYDTRNSRDFDQNAAVIGLYGELVSNSPFADQPFDGANNMFQVSFAIDGACFDPDVSPDGRTIAFASTMHRETADIYIKSANGQTLTQITSDPADDVMPAFSPSGMELAFASNRSGSWDIYVQSLDGSSVVRLTDDTDHELHPTWSPDGSRLAYCKFGSQSQRWELWVIELARPGSKQFLGYGMFPQWCPDITQNKILFQRARQRGSRLHSIWTIDYVNGEALHPTEVVSASNAAVINPSWSPDGRKIVFVTVVNPDDRPGKHPGESDVWVVNANGTNRTSLTNGQFAHYQPAWGSDGTVYFVSNRSGTDNVWAVTTNRTFEAVGPQSRIANVNPDTTAPER